MAVDVYAQERMVLGHGLKAHPTVVCAQVLGTSGNPTAIRAYSSSDRGQHWVRQGRSRRGLCSVQRRRVMGQSLRWAGAEQAKVSGKGQGLPCRL